VSDGRKEADCSPKNSEKSFLIIKFVGNEFSVNVSDSSSGIVIFLNGAEFLKLAGKLAGHIPCLVKGWTTMVVCVKPINVDSDKIGESPEICFFDDKNIIVKGESLVLLYDGFEIGLIVDLEVDGFAVWESDSRFPALVRLNMNGYNDFLYLSGPIAARTWLRIEKIMKFKVLVLAPESSIAPGATT
jgi:hypothetical protein